MFEGLRSAQVELSWSTRVEFDGLVRHDFIVTNSPRTESMDLEWTVKPAFARYLLTPRLKNLEGAGQWRFPFLGEARSGWQNNTTMWLTSERKGFAWTAEHDAHWVYEGEPISVCINEQGGRCSADMTPVRSPVLGSSLPLQLFRTILMDLLGKSWVSPSRGPSPRL